ncbi:hypothetical protein [Kribbella sindirgiensis]|uniref:Uncharacterized protein n=1 Tax=Kribbella sindirgiensis TaxID=1124744 RepID=A0A4R0J9F8_9ACTN|nr:hypothetical protein [Kribbella sindirgiensis]TCC43191.1 hypothetical protein E0H50_01515 [Kribbella sindirgiensis]
MLRPMVATTAVTAALILLAGCGGDDKKADSGSENNGGQSTAASSTPSTPTAPSFDPPKSFAPAAAYPAIEEKGRSTVDESQMGIAGQVALVGSWAGLSGHDVANPTNTWTVKSAEAETTEVYDASRPMAAKLDGKDVAIVAYAEADKGSGTQKPAGLVVVHWIDVASGKKVAEVTAKVSTLQDTGNTSGVPNLRAQAYDPETGQVAIGVTTAGVMNGEYQTVYADPATQKSTIVPGMNPAAVHAGVVAGSKGSQSDNSADGTALLVDGASGKVTKQLPLKQAYLTPLTGGAKHAYFYGMAYTDYGQGTKADTIFSVDLSTGAVAPTTPATKFESDVTIECLPDQASAVVCLIKSIRSGPLEVLGFDDTTGKKTWGFTETAGSRVVPNVTAAFHGVIYAQTEAQPVLLDAKTGADLPSGSSSSSPSSSDTPSSGDTPSSSDTPSGNDSPTGNESPGNGDLGLFDGKMRSPQAVSPYGGVYRQLPTGDNYGSPRVESVCIFLKPTA